MGVLHFLEKVHVFDHIGIQMRDALSACVTSAATVGPLHPSDTKTLSRWRESSVQFIFLVRVHFLG